MPREAQSLDPRLQDVAAGFTKDDAKRREQDESEDELFINTSP